MTDLFMADGFVFKPGEWQLAPADIFEFDPGQSLEEVQAEYQDKLFVVMQDYLYSSDPITAYRNEFHRYINDAFTMAFIAGWADAGASGELTEDAQSWLSGRIDEEIVYSDTLFAELKALRDDDTIPIDDKLEAAQAHAEGYANTLVGVYSRGKMMGDPERDGRWELGATEKHCQTGGGTMGCAQLNGQVHPLSWYLKRGLIPQEAGSNTITCGGWRCDCRIVDPKTGEQIIP